MKDVEHGERGGPSRMAKHERNVAAPMSPPPGLTGQEVTLQTLLQAIKDSQKAVADQHPDLKRDLNKMDREAREVKTTAAKALGRTEVFSEEAPRLCSGS